MNGKTHIIGLLEKEFPLSARQVYNRINYTISYQGVFKLLQELVEEGKIEKIDRRYLLKASWIEEEAKRFATLYHTYTKEAFDPQQIDTNALLQVFRFKSLAKLVAFLAKAYKNGQLDTQQTGEIDIIATRMFPILPTSVHDLVERLLQGADVRVHVKKNSLIDKLARRWLKGLGATIVNPEVEHYNLVRFGDCVVQYYFEFTDKQRDVMEDMAATTKNAFGLGAIASKLFRIKINAYIVINRQQTFVERVRQSMRT